jgi:AcrR family transcriptional regulator
MRRGVAREQARNLNKRAPEDTRAALIAYARALFTERGFTGTATEDIVIAAGITRAGLHHHFADKEDLFRTVFEELSAELVERFEGATATAKNGGEALRLGCHARLDACLDPAVQRIVLLDGPSVLGWEEWRRIDARYGMHSLRATLEAAMLAGAIPRQPVAPLALLLAGALNEAALDIASAPDRRAARRAVGKALDLLLDGLRRMVAR